MYVDVLIHVYVDRSTRQTSLSSLTFGPVCVTIPRGFVYAGPFRQGGYGYR